MDFVIRPEAPRSSPEDKLLVSYHFTRRSGIDVRIDQPADDTIGVHVTMTPAMPWSADQVCLGKRQVFVKWSDTEPLNDPQVLRIPSDQTAFAKGKINEILSCLDDITKCVCSALPGFLETLCNLGSFSIDPPLTVDNARFVSGVADISTWPGFVTYRCDELKASSPTDHDNEVVPTQPAAVPPGAGASVDDVQPYPIYGWITAEWHHPPVITLPSPSTTTVEATGASGASVTYSISAVSSDGKPVSVTCSPPSGSTFPIGTSMVTCSATDAQDATATTSFAVTVPDTTPPHVSTPANVIAEATGPSGAAVSFTVTATNLVDGATPVVCTPASGTTFALGTSTVTCSSTDAHGNTGTASFPVKVVDTTPPVLSISVTPTSIWPANHKLVAVTVTKTASDTVDQQPTVSCSASANETVTSGDIVQGANGGFELRADRLGSGRGRIYTISCTARDFAGNVSGPRTATVTVPHDQGH